MATPVPSWRRRSRCCDRALRGRRHPPGRLDAPRQLGGPRRHHPHLFIALRSYLPDDHEHKAAEIGSEPDPATVPRHAARVDRRSGGGCSHRGAASPSSSATRGRPTLRRLATRLYVASPIILQLYATSLAYGRNLLTGQPSPAGQWLVRNVIVWHRPNPAVGALGDKVRPSTSYITVATRSAKRWFDLDAWCRPDDAAVRRSVAGGHRQYARLRVASDSSGSLEWRL